MKCLEFKRLALSDPNTDNPHFIEHGNNCPDCLKYVGGIKKMDSQLVDSVAVEIPDDLVARLELNQVLAKDTTSWHAVTKRYAKVASMGAIMFASGFMLKDYLSSPDGGVLSGGGSLSVESADGSLHADGSLLAEGSSHADGFSSVSGGIVVEMIDHIEGDPMAPVWEAGRANETMKVLLSNYDSVLKLKHLARLQFIQVCPMGKERTALHANLGTDHGQITFAYIKGDSVAEITNASYKGYMTRVKPVPGGNLLIISRNMSAIDDADAELESAMYWDV